MAKAIMENNSETFREERSALCQLLPSTIGRSAMDATQDDPGLWPWVYGLARHFICASMRRDLNCYSMVDRCTLQAKVVSSAIDWHAPRNWVQRYSATSDAMPMALLGVAEPNASYSYHDLDCWRVRQNFWETRRQVPK